MSEFKSILIEKLQALSEELAIDPAFLEKDWYATHALQLLQEATDTTFECIFSGGTCLSKAYHLNVFRKIWILECKAREFLRVWRAGNL